MTKLPKLTRRTRGKKEFGAWYILVQNKPLSLNTNRRPLAVERRLEAVRRGARKWPRVWDAEIRDVTKGAADSNLAALGDVAPESESTNVAGTNGPGADAGGGVMGPPPAPDVSAPRIPVIEPEPLPPPPDAGNWAADMNAPPAQADAPPEAAAGLRLSDLPWLDSVIVTASKAAVGLQLTAQAWTMKLVGDVEAGRVGPPPKLQQPDGPESMAAFMAAAGARWDASDPRERGRKAYEQTVMKLVAMIPATLPAWVAWLEAPIVTAIDTVPVQMAGAKKIKRDAAGNELGDDAPLAEAPPDERAAA